MDTAEQRHAATAAAAVTPVQSGRFSDLLKLSSGNLPVCPLWSYKKRIAFRHNVMMIDDT